jgi:hypothetical protein
MNNIPKVGENKQFDQDCMYQENGADVDPYHNLIKKEVKNENKF